MVFLVVSCFCIASVVWYAMCMFVPLKMFVIVLVSLPIYVNFAQLLLFCAGGSAVVVFLGCFG
jgi:hypothetical protein